MVRFQMLHIHTSPGSSFLPQAKKDVLQPGSREGFSGSLESNLTLTLLHHVVARDDREAIQTPISQDCRIAHMATELSDRQRRNDGPMANLTAIAC